MSAFTVTGGDSEADFVTTRAEGRCRPIGACDCSENRKNRMAGALWGYASGHVGAATRSLGEAANRPALGVLEAPACRRARLASHPRSSIRSRLER
jgi:hypothetical protein